MAQTATEYKEDLLRKLNGEAASAERDAAYWTAELPFSETDKIAETTQKKIDTSTELAAYLRTLEAAVLDIDVP